MTLREQFAVIREHAENNQPSSMEFPVGGTTYLRNFRPRERLLLLGCGNIAQALCEFASSLDFAVTAADDRLSFANRGYFPGADEIICNSFPAAIQRFGITKNDYIAVVTRGHSHDILCLREILSGVFPRYLGVIGSRKRAAGLLRLLEEEGFSRAFLDQIHTPIGLNIGALTVKEIAISILAELIACRRQNIARRSESSVLTTEETDIPLLRFLTDETRQKAFLLVLETNGSTPVKSGAMMAIDKNLQTKGTIGGGCGEGTALREAFALIGTGKSRCVTVDMGNDIAAEEGMVCGGNMKVWIADIG